MNLSFNNIFRFCFISAIILIVTAGDILIAQSPSDIKEKIYDRGEELEDLKTIIEDLKKEIKQKESTEVSVVKQISMLNKQLDYTTRYLSRLDQEIEQRDAEVNESRKVIKASNAHLTKLKNRFSKRSVQMFKSGTYSDFELLLTSASVSQFFYRMKYLKIINDYDRKLSSSINRTITDLEVREIRLVQEINLRERNIKEKEKEKRNFVKNRRERKNLLRRVRQDKSSLRQIVKDKEEAAKQVESIIAALEDERKRLEELARRRNISIEDLVIDADFASFKGNLVWPTVGKVVSRFGKRKHPTLKTITENSGIDIRVKEGTEVVSVLTGRVTSITWIRGFGNTVIIDHGRGYYSVYTHLSEIFVTPTETVATGQRIASVGETGSLEGSELHFEIWHNREKQNPLHWLKKNL
ncbi:hypothetical protein E3V55_03170 [Candidatus Marinimicrobia bacterium MT.SAG.3]|nr:hypothetical protein E3V55_03170 [Candidatus Marinimicrobia bacterium MT.SAG.3]